MYLLLPRGRQWEEQGTGDRGGEGCGEKQRWLTLGPPLSQIPGLVGSEDLEENRETSNTRTVSWEEHLMPTLNTIQPLAPTEQLSYSIGRSVGWCSRTLRGRRRGVTICPVHSLSSLRNLATATRHPHFSLPHITTKFSPLEAPLKFSAKEQ